MRIVVDDIAASKTGALSILRDFYNAVREYPEDAGQDEWIFVLGDRFLEETGSIKVLVRNDVKSSRKNRLMFDLKSGAGYFESLKPDVLFSLQNTLPRGYRGKQVLYVHQPLPYQTWKKFSFLKTQEREYAVYQHLIGRMIDSSVKRADKVIVQTEWMRKAVTDKTRVPLDKVVKILPDVDVPKEYLGGERDGTTNNNVINNNVINNDVIKRFFYPSGEILYKNHGLILEAAGILINRGITGFEVLFTLDKGDLPYLGRYPEYEQIKYIGRIPRNEVFKHYLNDILLFPSYIETFGYPPAEARAVGGRILASDCPFSREVLKGYGRAEYFDPFKPEELADLMERALKNRLFADPEPSGTIDSDRGGNGWFKVIDIIRSLNTE